MVPMVLTHSHLAYLLIDHPIYFCGTGAGLPLSYCFWCEKGLVGFFKTGFGPRAPSHVQTGFDFEQEVQAGGTYEGGAQK